MEKTSEEEKKNVGEFSMKSNESGAPSLKVISNDIEASISMEETSEQKKKDVGESSMKSNDSGAPSPNAISNDIEVSISMEKTSEGRKKDVGESSMKSNDSGAPSPNAVSNDIMVSISMEKTTEEKKKDVGESSTKSNESEEPNGKAIDCDMQVFISMEEASEEKKKDGGESSMKSNELGEPSLKEVHNDMEASKTSEEKKKDVGESSIMSYESGEQSPKEIHNDMEDTKTSEGRKDVGESSIKSNETGKPSLKSLNSNMELFKTSDEKMNDVGMYSMKSNEPGNLSSKAFDNNIFYKTSEEKKKDERESSTKSNESGKPSSKVIDNDMKVLKTSEEKMKDMIDSSMKSNESGEPSPEVIDNYMDVFRASGEKNEDMGQLGGKSNESEEPSMKEIHHNMEVIKTSEEKMKAVGESSMKTNETGERSLKAVENNTEVYKSSEEYKKDIRESSMKNHETGEPSPKVIENDMEVFKKSEVKMKDMGESNMKNNETWEPSLKAIENDMEVFKTSEVKMKDVGDSSMKNNESGETSLKVIENDMEVKTRKVKMKDVGESGMKNNELGEPSLSAIDNDMEASIATSRKVVFRMEKTSEETLKDVGESSMKSNESREPSSKGINEDAKIFISTSQESGFTMEETSEQKMKDVGEPSMRSYEIGEPSQKELDNDDEMEVYISLSQELKNEGNKLFQKRDLEGAIVNYEEAIRLLPRNHIDVAYLRSNMAACYMQMGLSEYTTAIDECNLALEVCPRYTKALLKRGKCYEALNRLDLAYKDVDLVLNIEPNHVTALEIADRIKRILKEKGLVVDSNGFSLSPTFAEAPCVTPRRKLVRQKTKRKKRNKAVEGKATEDAILGEENQNKLVAEETLKFFAIDESGFSLSSDFAETPDSTPRPKLVRQKTKKKKNRKAFQEKKTEDKVVVEENQDKLVVAENLKIVAVDEPQKTVKLVFGEDIRWIRLLANCSVDHLIEEVRYRFPMLTKFLIKYKDQEGDLVMITTTEELRLAEATIEPQSSVKLYIVDASPKHKPLLGVQNFGRMPNDKFNRNSTQKKEIARKLGEIGKWPICIEDWIIQFAMSFKIHVGFDADSYLDVHELGMKLYSEAMEDTITSEEAQDLFEIVAEKFREMTALALFNWGNVHMSKAKKKVLFSEDASREITLEQVKAAYEWAQKEYIKAGVRYETALKIKPDFYEALLALGQQQFEQAKISWYTAITCEVDMATWPATEVLQLFDNAEDTMEKGAQIWEELEEQRLKGRSKSDTTRIQLQKMGLKGLFKDVSEDEAEEQAANMRSQINLLWGTILYERAIVEFKLGLPGWEECLEDAVERIELAEASPTDLAVIVKNHCANKNAFEGSGFKIDEIVQAWNEMYDAKRWKHGIPSFRLEPLFRQRVHIFHLPRSLKSITQ